MYNALHGTDYVFFAGGVAAGVIEEILSGKLWVSIGIVLANVTSISEQLHSLTPVEFMTLMVTAPAVDYEKFKEYVEQGGGDNATLAGRIAGQYLAQAGLIVTGAGGAVVLTKKAIAQLADVRNIRAARRSLNQLNANAKNNVASHAANKSRRGGRLGNEMTRKQIADIATELEKRGYSIFGGGGKKMEEFLKPINGGRKGGSYLDLTAIHPKYGTLRINTVDVLKDNLTPSSRELRNAARIRSQIKPGEHLLLIPKIKIKK